MRGHALLGIAVGLLCGCNDNRSSNVTHASAGTGGSPGVGTTIVSLTLDSEAASASTAPVPVTFAHAFAIGDVPAGLSLAARTDDGQNVPLQVDAKAKHADGSLRHAILTLLVPNLGAGESKIELVRAGSESSGANVALADVLATPLDVEVSLNLGGKSYTASARDLLTHGSPSTWLSGPIAGEWDVGAPLRDAAGVPHPQLSAWFEVRGFQTGKSAWVSVAIDNDWAYAPDPQNYTYDASIRVAGVEAWSKTGIVHSVHSRWRKTFWWGEAPSLRVREDTRYLIDAGIVPNYDPTIQVSESALADLDTRWSGQRIEPMGPGLAEAAMPTTGGRADIGLLPAWAAACLLSMDARAERAMLGTADLSGSWPIHYRDQNTGRIASLEDYPYMTLLGTPGDATDPATGVSQSFPACAGDCSSPLNPDSAHQPSLVYLPYLLTGDRYYLEELQFWANYNMLQANPGYREQEKGLLNWDQTRGQAWSLRTLGEVAFITPDEDPMKGYFNERVANNIAKYRELYLDNPNTNALGWIGDRLGDALPVEQGVLAGYVFSAPWMDDFFTSSVDHLVELGFSDAAPLLAWKARYPVGRMLAPGYCWIFGAPYTMIVGDGSHYFDSFQATYEPSMIQDGHDAALGTTCGSQAMATALGLTVGEMIGYSESAEGYPSNLQPALAAAVDAHVSNADAAWKTFMARSVKPDYSSEPQFAIVPRVLSR